MGIQVTDSVRVHLSAIPAPVIALTGYLLSPEFYNLLPEKYAHIVYFLAVLAATAAPQLVKKTPPADLQG